MPRRLPTIPVYEIPAVDGLLRLKITPDRRHLHMLLETDVGVDGGNQVEAIFDAAAWVSICELRDTLMPKRSRRGKVTDG